MTSIICEIGLNHNSDINLAYRLIDVASAAGCDYVKFQKREPDICVPEDQKGILRQTPWGTMTYLDYRKKMEFGVDEYDKIDSYCRARDIKWSASAWDEESLSFLKRYDLDFIKIPSALLTNWDLLSQVGFPLILSTGMSDLDMIDHAVEATEKENIKAILHCTSTYPCKAEEINLNCIKTLKDRYPWATIGFSNHHPGLVFMPAAVALGAEVIEFHITLDRSMWGTDQSASIEPEGVFKLVKWIRSIEQALGDGEKRIYESEIPIMQKLRRK
jgi:N-acetylneuraminate synthase